MEIADSGIEGVRCDAVITGYRDITPDRNTKTMLEKLENVPFFVGVANGGIHTFVGHKGSVCDFHWTAQPNDKDAMTENPVRQWKWDTGLYWCRRDIGKATGIAGKAET